MTTKALNGTPVIEQTHFQRQGTPATLTFDSLTPKSEGLFSPFDQSSYEV